jgi:hypothetical protein
LITKYKFDIKRKKIYDRRTLETDLFLGRKEPP